MNENSLQSDVGLRLKRWLAFKNWTIRELSDRSGVPYSTLQNYLGGARRPGAEHLAKLAAAGVNLNWLLTGTSGPNRVPISSDLVNSDAELMGALILRALEIIDRQQKLRIDRNEAPAPLIYILTVLLHLMRNIVRTAESRAEMIGDLRRRGLSTAQVVEAITGGEELQAAESMKGMAFGAPSGTELVSLFGPIFSLAAEPQE